MIVVLALASASDLSQKNARARASEDELRALLAEYRAYDVQMGYADGSTYEDTFDRVLVAFDHPLYLDAGSQMDSTAAGYSASRMLRDHDGACRNEIWILPYGEPFALRSFYRPAREGPSGTGRGGPVFDDGFRARFAERYALLRSGTYYRVYGCAAGA